MVGVGLADGSAWPGGPDGPGGAVPDRDDKANWPALRSRFTEVIAGRTLGAWLEVFRALVGVRGVPKPSHPLLARVEQADDLVHADLLQQRPEVSRRVEIENLRDADHAPVEAGTLVSRATPVIHLTMSSTLTSCGRRLATI